MAGRPKRQERLRSVGIDIAEVNERARRSSGDMARIPSYLMDRAKPKPLSTQAARLTALRNAGRNKQKGGAETDPFEDEQEQFIAISQSRAKLHDLHCWAEDVNRSLNKSFKENDRLKTELLTYLKDLGMDNFVEAYESGHITYFDLLFHPNSPVNLYITPH